MNEKRKEISPKDIKNFLDIYNRFEESEFSQIHDNNFFRYTKVTVDQPIKENGVVLKNKKGDLKPDKSKRDYEHIPFWIDIDTYFEEEVKPNLPDSWMDRSKDKIGYEINFRKYFYQYSKFRENEEIFNELGKIESQIQKDLDKLT